MQTLFAALALLPLVRGMAVPTGFMLQELVRARNANVRHPEIKWFSLSLTQKA